MTRVRVIGAGPAGTAAAITAVRHGASVDLFEKSRFPRHKVCGEFLSPQATQLLEILGLDWRSLQPAPIRRLELCFGQRRSLGNLPETAYGLSRYLLDSQLLNLALGTGVTLHRTAAVAGEGPTVIATGRHSAAPKGKRLFGFKAHFAGPSSDTMELYFHARDAYVGVNAVEGGLTNVCGIAPEDALAAHGFEIDSYLDAIPALRDRLRGCRRQWGWIRTGPLVFEMRAGNGTKIDEYYAGDSLSFVDPFTGSGMLTALWTGALAGKAAAQEISTLEYDRDCRKLLGQAKIASTVFRLSIYSGLATWLERIIPHSVLFRLSRPRFPLTIS